MERLTEKGLYDLTPIREQLGFAATRTWRGVLEEEAWGHGLPCPYTLQPNPPAGHLGFEGGADGGVEAGLLAAARFLTLRF